MTKEVKRFEQWWDAEDDIPNNGPYTPDTPIQFAWAGWQAALTEQPAQKRPQNCGTGYCSCIECVMEPAQPIIKSYPEKDNSAQQEPVAWMYQCSADNSGPVLMQHKQDWAKSGSGLWTEAPLYTSPPPQQEPVELCQYGQEPASCTSNPMDCQCAIDAALAQPEQESVAVHQFRNRYVTDWYDGVPDHQDGHGPYEVRTLYIAPPAQRTWVGLTQEQIESCYGGEIDDFARAIEAKSKELNT